VKPTDIGRKEFLFAELRTLCWNPGYAFVWHLSASEGDLDP
jgi:hypothetical protein